MIKIRFQRKTSTHHMTMNQNFHTWFWHCPGTCLPTKENSWSSLWNALTVFLGPSKSKLSEFPPRSALKMIFHKYFSTTENFRNVTEYGGLLVYRLQSFVHVYHQCWGLKMRSRDTFSIKSHFFPKMTVPPAQRTVTVVTKCTAPNWYVLSIKITIVTSKQMTCPCIRWVFIATDFYPIIAKTTYFLVDDFWRSVFLQPGTEKTFPINMTK